MQGVDLAQFQFDYDLTWSAMMLDSAGTVLARYGGRSADGPMSVNSIDGFRRTMQRVLNVYPQRTEHTDWFAAKKGPKPEYGRPEHMQVEVVRNALNAGNNNKACIHCHNIHDAQHQLAEANGTYDPQKVWKYPPTQNLGFTLDVNEGTRVTAVEEGSLADRADLQVGDNLVSANGQRLLSLADVQFVLHFLPEPATLSLNVDRAGSQRTLTLELPNGWRRSDISWRVSMYGMYPRPGLWIDSLPADQKESLGLPDDQLAVIVKGLFGEAVRTSDLKKNDVIVNLDGKSHAMTPGQFHEQIRLKHFKRGSVMQLEILRDGKKRNIDVQF